MIAQKAINIFEKVQVFQRKIYLSTKADNKRKFGVLYDKVYRKDILKVAWFYVKRNKGSAGIDDFTIEIIKRYEPRYFIIENPASGRLWKYIEEVMGFKLPYLNITRYNNYDYPLQKPTKFASNLDLGLKNDIIKQDVEWKHFSKSYNERSNIPQNLVTDIFTKVYKKFLQEKQNDNQN